MGSVSQGRGRVAGAVLVAVLAAACGGGARREREAKEALKQRLQGPAPAELGPRAKDLWKSASRYYEKNGYAFVWMDGSSPNSRAKSLQTAVSEVAADGLDPRQYDFKWLEPLQTGEKSWNPLRRKAVPPAQVAEAEVRFTTSFLKLASELLVGRVDPARVNPHWFGQYRLVAPERMLERVVETGRVRATLNGLVPHHPQYEALRQAMQRYRDLAAKGGWPTGFVAGKGALTAEKTAALRARLAAEGDLAGGTAASAPPAPAGGALDPALRDALKRFEERHGLPPDGRLDGEAVRELNVPVETRVRQMALNLERWRWLPESLGDKHILVNIPSFWLVGVEKGKTTIQMRVVTGKVENPTPVFSDLMTTVVFSPYWNVPPSIAKDEIRPALLRDPGYLDRNDMEVVRESSVVSPFSVDWEAGGFTVRQRPGAKNALGQVKFIFPNNFDVYLHDTPADALFSSRDRSFSHGCVRVEKPFELAQWVLAGQAEWTPERIREAMEARRERHVALKDSLPVYIVYATAWSEPDGRVSFRDDLYGHDAKQMKLLPPSPPAARVASNEPVGARAQ
ncbi:MAG TPA: L,D-transpeptidase family protein [Vicinamibacteria bacterium]|nr:L,D-transpeptidase family protein [Vicinamibacteria bacterium]